MTIIGRKRGSNLPALSEPRHPPLAAPPADELALALQLARAEKSPSTRRAYRNDFDAFRKWCAVRKLDALPAAPATLATFLASEAKRGVKASTIGRRVTGVGYAHMLAGQKPPGQSEIVKATLRGICRTISTSLPSGSASTSRRETSMKSNVLHLGKPKPFSPAAALAMARAMTLSGDIDAVHSRSR
jgi:hypothetical protein